jgi:hypothetical protein
VVVVVLAAVVLCAVRMCMCACVRAVCGGGAVCGWLHDP